nr:hypothetical protein [Tanacetum cinerariifolium]
MPAKDDCSPVFTTFSNPLFKDDDNFDSSDDESLPDEDVPAEEFKFIRILFSMKMKSILIIQDGNSQQEKINIVTETDDVLPLSIENFADDPEGDIRFLEELLIDDS